MDGQCNKRDGFKWIKNTSQFNKDFIKTTMKIVMKHIFLKLMLNILKIHVTVTVIYNFYLKE